jgi:hypothetical protein
MNLFFPPAKLQLEDDAISIEEGMGLLGKSVEMAMTSTPPSREPICVRKHTCSNECCATDSNFKETFTTTDNAIIPLVGRSAGQKPFIPQSYNYSDFERNQIRAIGQKSRRLTLEVVQQVFAQHYNDTISKEVNALVTNFKVLTHCRFSPEYKGLSHEETFTASEGDIIVPGPLADSVVGCLLLQANTVSGQEFLLVRGANPTNHVSAILNRQAAIQVLLDDEAIRSQLEGALRTYGESENEFCSRLTPDATKLPGRIESYLKFAILDIPESMGRHVNAYIRESTVLLTVNNCIKTVQDFFSVALLMVIAVVLVEYALSLMFPSMYKSSTEAYLTAFVARYIGQTGAMISLLQSVDHVGSKLAAACLGTFIACARAPDLFGYWRAEMKVKIALQKKMVSTAKCIRVMVLVHGLIAKHSELGHRLEQFAKLQGFVQSQDSKAKKLLRAISSSALDAPSRFSVNFGPVIVAWNLLLDKDVRRQVLEAIVALGEIDATVTLANKIRLSTREHPFSLPELVHSEEAVMELRSAHFAPVSSHSTNTAHADTHVVLPPISILTAENGAGKTTFALAWMNILLSTQTFGVAACGPGSRVSVFDSIVTSMGVSDSNQESSHESHERYEKELLLKLRHHPGEKVFVLLDELYRGTHEEKGAAKLRALSFELIRKSKQLKVVFITHFRTFANDPSVDAVRYTTRKDGRNKPSGHLEEGVYDFPVEVK